MEGFHYNVANAIAVLDGGLVSLASQYASTYTLGFVVVDESVLDGCVLEAYVLESSALSTAEETSLATIVDDDCQVSDDMALTVEGAAVGGAYAHSVSCAVAVQVKVVPMAGNGSEVGDLAHVDIVGEYSVQASVAVVGLIGEPNHVVWSRQLINAVYLLRLVTADYLIDVIVAHSVDECQGFLVATLTALEHLDDRGDNLVVQFLEKFRSVDAVDILQLVRHIAKFRIDELALVDAFEDVAQLAQQSVLLSTRGGIVYLCCVCSQFVLESYIVVGSFLVVIQVWQIVVGHVVDYRLDIVQEGRHGCCSMLTLHLA